MVPVPRLRLLAGWPALRLALLHQGLAEQAPETRRLEMGQMRTLRAASK